LAAADQTEAAQSGCTGVGKPARILSSNNQTVAVAGCSEGLKIKAAEWLELSRGISRERVLENGVRIANVTDELPQRAFYRQWKKLVGDHRSSASDTEDER
jgi:hypothetical protein